ncbi:MAG: replication-associated recombination protein A [Myxococcota bacterium]|nr:replication-associated recombination protein A [Myxococcota bacterium]
MDGDLFSRAADRDPSLTPLADRMRPQTLEGFVGQAHLLGPDKFLTQAIASDRVPSLVLWGPPGTGKTTLAKILAHHTGGHFVPFSAVSGTLKGVREIIHKADDERRMYKRRTILFIDEIHRFNKAQQDALLPSAESGVITLVGATTENPSFSVIPALLSRCKVVRLDPLDPASLIQILRRALEDTDRGLGNMGLHVDEDALELIADSARGDARFALNALEAACQYALARRDATVDVACVEASAHVKSLLYDKTGEEHYNVISAFIKSMRGSDPDAALYWMFRMIEAGEDPLFVLRRMIIFASEDIGNADPHALQFVMAADAAFQRIGMPEGAFPLAQACTYLASAPKSNAQVAAISGPRRDIAAHGPLPVPNKLRNAPTKLMKQWGYGQGYRYPHDEGGYAPEETYLPDALVGRRYYLPKDVGVEARIAEHLRRLRENKAK